MKKFAKERFEALNKRIEDLGGKTLPSWEKFDSIAQKYLKNPASPTNRPETPASPAGKRQELRGGKREEFTQTAPLTPGTVELFAEGENVGQLSAREIQERMYKTWISEESLGNSLGSWDAKDLSGVRTGAKFTRAYHL